MVFILLLLLVLAVLWWLAAQLRMPDDFRVAVADGPDLAHAVSVRAADGNRLARLWTLRGRLPLRSRSMDRVIGTIVPTREDLYAFRPEPGFFELSCCNGGDQWQLVSQQAEGVFEVSAHRTYRVKGADQSQHYFRCQYDSDSR